MLWEPPQQLEAMKYARYEAARFIREPIKHFFDDNVIYLHN